LDAQDSIEHHLSQVLLQDNYEETMPGFHEHDENDMLFGMDEDNEDDPDTDEVSDRNEEKNLDVGASTIWKPHSATVVGKLKDFPDQTTPSTYSESSSHTCPICSKTLNADNNGLNAHLDFCLSREAIKEAHAESASPAHQSRKPKSQNMSGWMTSRKMNWKGKDS
jgi:DNA polymerase kappa